MSKDKDTPPIEGKAGEKKTVKRDYELTPEERRQRSQELAGAVSELRELQGKMKASAATYKAKEKGINARIDTLSTAVHSGKEPREEQYTWTTNTTGKLLELTGPDGHVAQTRALTPEERQAEMFPLPEPTPIGKGKAKPKKDGPS